MTLYIFTYYINYPNHKCYTNISIQCKICTSKELLMETLRKSKLLLVQK